MRIKAPTQHKEIMRENASEDILRGRGGVSFTVSSSNSGESETRWEGEVSNNTETEIFLNGEADNRYTCPANTVITINYICLAIDTATYECKTWDVVGFIRRDGSDNTRVKVRSNPAGQETEMSSANFYLDYDDINESIKPMVQGITGKTIRFILGTNPTYEA